MLLVAWLDSSAKETSQDFAYRVNIFLGWLDWLEDSVGGGQCAADVELINGVTCGHTHKGNLRTCLLNTISHEEVEQLMSSFYFLIVLGIQYRKVQEIQEIFWSQSFAGAGETKGGTLLDLLLTNKKEVAEDGKADRNFSITVL